MGFVSGFNLGIFSFSQSIGVTQTISGFLSEKNALCIAVDLVYLWEEMRSKASILDQNPLANSMSLDSSKYCLSTVVVPVKWSSVHSLKKNKKQKKTEKALIGISL